MYRLTEDGRAMARAELDRAQQALNFRVEQTGTISLEVNAGRPGVVTPILPWSLEQ